jgi:BirA family biotin operon repressor/biotin-[acetyl-CoA-carboxylase] ligase
VFDDETLRSLAPQGAIGSKVEYFATIGSTNDRAIELAKLGSPHGTLVLADEQTAGRGRGGRKWWSPKGTSLSLSVLLRPQFQSTPGLFSGLGALAVCEAVEELGGQPEVKWPNDVLLTKQKVAGVLVEASWVSSKLDHIVVGMGVNVRPASIPPEADFPATCLEDELKGPIEMSKVLASILRSLDRWTSRFDPHELHSAWQQRLAYMGQAVIYGRELQGIIVGLGQEGELILRFEDGSEEHLIESEYHLRPVDTEKE